MYYGVEMKKWEKPVGGELLFSEYAYKLNANAQYTYNQSFTASSDGVVSISCSAFYSYISKQLSYNIVTVTVNGVEIPTITLYDYDAYATGGNAKTLFEVRKYDTVTIKYTAYMVNGNSGYCYVSYNGYLFKGLRLPDIVNVGSFTNTASSSWNITQKDDTIFTINDDKSITVLKEGSIKINFKPVDSGAYGDIYKNGTQYLHFRNSGGNGNTELVVDVVEGDIITLITGSGQTISEGKITFWSNEEIEDVSTITDVETALIVDRLTGADLSCTGTGEQFISYTWTVPKTGNYYINTYGNTSYSKGYYCTRIYVNDETSMRVALANNNMGALLALNEGDVVRFAGLCNNNDGTSRGIQIKIIGCDAESNNESVYKLATFSGTASANTSSLADVIIIDRIATVTDNVITMNKAGLLRLLCYVAYETTNDAASIELVVNGATVYTSDLITNAGAYITTTYNVAVGDTVQIKAVSSASKTTTVSDGILYLE